ncbi:MAG: GntR family transcriptional regulator [Planctomycetes bacterium]|nr:GntR family transcriptional regulator [Planctomycetota bacterium]
MAKFQAIAETLKSRLGKGDYVIGGLPSERRLASELGVSRMTARRAIQMLVDEGTLVRHENGRLDNSATMDRQEANYRVAFLSPASSSPFTKWLCRATEHTGRRMGVQVRAIDFVHPDDPIVGETLESFDAVLLCGIDPKGNKWLSGRLADQSKKKGTPVVCMDHDGSDFGIPSILTTPPSCVPDLLDYLASLGHYSVDCWNFLPSSQSVLRRIDQWRIWCEERKLGEKAQLVDNPVPNYGKPIEQGYQTMKAYISSGKKLPSAIFITGEVSSMGVMRALSEEGVKIGKDISICSLGGDGYYRYLNPSLTVLELEDPDPYLEICFNWIIGGGEWDGPLVIGPDKMPLFVGESTGPLKGKR